MCESMIGDHGEVTLYNVYKLKPSSQHLLKNFLCYGDYKRDKCSKLEEKKFKEEKKVKKQSKNKNKEEL